MSKNIKKCSGLLDNKGFSLVELLVVLAIVSIITAMAGLTLGVVNNANVSKAATRFESMLTRSRAESIARGTDAGMLTISCENGKIYGQVGTGEKELICNKQIAAYVGDVNSGFADPYGENSLYLAAGNLLTDGNSVEIKFSPAGSVMTNDGGAKNLCKLLFVKGNRRVEVVLYRQTGKHESRAF